MIKSGKNKQKKKMHQNDKDAMCRNLEWNFESFSCPGLYSLWMGSKEVIQVTPRLSPLYLVKCRGKGNCENETLWINSWPHIGNKAWHFENNNKIIQGTFNIKKKTPQIFTLQSVGTLSLNTNKDLYVTEIIA